MDSNESSRPRLSTNELLSLIDCLTLPGAEGACEQRGVERAELMDKLQANFSSQVERIFAASQGEG